MWIDARDALYSPSCIEKALFEIELWINKNYNLSILIVQFMTNRITY